MILNVIEGVSMTVMLPFYAILVISLSVLFIKVCGVSIWLSILLSVAVVTLPVGCVSLIIKQVQQTRKRKG